MKSSVNETDLGTLKESAKNKKSIHGIPGRSSSGFGEHDTAMQMN